MIRSMSAGARPAVWIARRPATAAIDAVVSSAAATRRSRMPVRVTIHSSEVSTIRSRSALVRTWAGA
jgi:mRNA-degrading endonuclease toxin of MazEF toxin-antitoxin module